MTLAVLVPHNCKVVILVVKLKLQQRSVEKRSKTQLINNNCGFPGCSFLPEAKDLMNACD